MAFGRTRRGSASGVAAIMMTIMIVATAISGAMIYYSRSGGSPAVGTEPSSGAVSGPAMNDLTSALGGLSGNLSSPALENLTLLGGLSNPALTNLTSALEGLSGGLSNSNLATTLGGNVSVTASLPAGDFTAAGETSTFSCAGSPLSAYLTLTNSGMESAYVSSVSIASASAVTEFTPSGPCEIGAAGSAASTVYVTFPATSQIDPNPLAGAYYAGIVSLSDGSQVAFAGIWV